jgi:tetratricopeptide (TPR) repeat protein
MYLFAGQFQRTESLYQTTVTALAKPERGYARSRLTYIGVFQGKFNKTLRLADDCITANKLDGMEDANAYLYLKKGAIYDCLEMWDSAAANARISEKLIAELTPADTGLYDLNFIRWYYRAGDTARAARLLQRLSAPVVLRSRQRASEYWCAMGEIALARAEYPRAIEYFSRADSLLSNFLIGQPVLYRLGEAYWESGDASSAIRVLEKLLKDYYQLINPSSYLYATAHYLLGRAYEATGDKAKAESAYEEFLTIWKDADPELKDVEDAKARLTRLKAKS